MLSHLLHWLIALVCETRTLNLTIFFHIVLVCVQRLLLRESPRYFGVTQYLSTVPICQLSTNGNTRDGPPPIFNVGDLLVFA
jgi:hypothetical protein